MLIHAVLAFYKTQYSRSDVPEDVWQLRLFIRRMQDTLPFGMVKIKPLDYSKDDCEAMAAKGVAHFLNEYFANSDIVIGFITVLHKIF